MSIRPCLTSAVAQKEITQAAADELDLLFNRFVAQNALLYGDAEARRRAQEQIAKRLEASAQHKRRVALLQATAIERASDAVFSYKNAKGENDPGRGMIELLETFGQRDEGLSTGSVMGRQKAILGSALAEFETNLDDYSKTLGGTRRNKAQLDNVVRELFGQGTGDQAAKQFAESWQRIAEGLRQRYNELGGAIGKLEKWALPQMHDARALRKVQFPEWSRRISDLLDWDNMRHALSGDPILPGERAEVLQHVFDTITTEGWSGRPPSTQAGGKGALYKQRSDHRFLVFKDADAWLSYQADFGQGDPFAAMMGHLSLMSRDIAAMQILGPNPDATLTWLKSEYMREAQKARRGEAARVPRGVGRAGVTSGLFSKDPVSRANYHIHRVETMWDHYSGSADVAVGQGFADALATTRNLTSAGALGSAILSAVSDPGFGAMARSFAAGQSVPGGLISQVGSIAESLKGMTRQQAVRAGLILDSAANTTGQAAREAGAMSGPIMSRYMADTVMRVQGLAAWTQAGKHGFGLYLMGEIGDQVSNSFDALKPEVQRLFRRYGLDGDQWEIIRQAGLYDLSPDGEGATILRPREIAALTVNDLGMIVGSNATLKTNATAVLDTLKNITEQEYRSWRGADAFRQLPRYLQDMVGGANGLSLDEMRGLMQRLLATQGPNLDRLEGFPSIPSDAVDAKVSRYFRDLAERYHEMILQETAYAVPEPTLRSKAITLGGTQPGTIQGEAFRAFGQFKSFGVAVALLHGGRVFNELAQGRKASGALYAVAGLATLTTLGMVAMQAKQVAKGEDLRDMEDWRVWSGAMVQSGGFGIYGDFFLADQNRLGGGLTQTIVGPIPGRAADILKATLGNIQQAAEGKQTNWQREVLKNVNTLNPLASLWFTRTAWDRLGYRQIQRLVDPEAAQDMARAEQTARRNRGTGYWWRPGDAAPSRPPEMGRSAGR